MTVGQDAAPPVIQTRGLSKRYRKVTALSEATIAVPEGRISALIGPNGAGKTTLLRLLSGLAKPSGGDVAVLGGIPRQDPAFLAGIGFLAQEIPLYRRLTAADHIDAGAHLNPGWDAASVRHRLKSLDIPLGQAVGTLSGGQRAQVALALTLAKQPRLLLLDEPVAALDPLARRHFLATLAEAVAADGLTVVLSSHLVVDLERICDHLILLAASRVQLCGDLDTVLAEHQVLVGPRKDTTAIEKTYTLVQAVRTARQTTWLVWRQHRNQAYFAAAALAAFAGLLFVTGLRMASQYHSALASCAASNRCGNLANSLSLGTPVLFNLVTLTLVVPCLLGVFWGGPLVARELETGTSQFAWMQSVTRRHWLAVKAGWILLAAAAWGGAVAALVTWWSGPENALKQQNFDAGQFDIQGIVPARGRSR